LVCFLRGRGGREREREGERVEEEEVVVDQLGCARGGPAGLAAKERVAQR
jgi:hypothetical protein